MSKTVIKQGTDPNYEYASRCRICGTIFKYEYSDMEGDPIQAWHEPHITCPTCGNMMAMNDKPIQEIDVNLPANSLYKIPYCVLIESGVDAYIVYKSGSVYLLKPITGDDLTPSNATILFTSAMTKLTIIPGVQIDNPEFNLEYARVDKIGDNNFEGYSTIDVAENKIVEIDSNEHIYGIPSALVESIDIKIIE